MRIKRKLDKSFYAYSSEGTEVRLLRKKIVRELCSLGRCKVSDSFLEALEARLVQVLLESCTSLRAIGKVILKGKDVKW